MDNERLNRWLSLLANFGVLVGILLLVFELSQNRELMRAQIRNELSQGVIDVAMASVTNDGLSDIIYRADLGQSLTPTEQFRYEWRSRAVIRYIENVHYQYRHGLYDESEFLKQKVAWKNYLGHSKNFTMVYCGYREAISDELIRELDTLLTTYEC